MFLTYKLGQSTKLKLQDFFYMIVIQFAKESTRIQFLAHMKTRMVCQSQGLIVDHTSKILAQILKLLIVRY